MKTAIIIWAIIGDIMYFWMAINDFKMSDKGIKKEYLDKCNRGKWQKNKAYLELGIAILGIGAILSIVSLRNKVTFVICACAILLLFGLTIANDNLIKKP